MPSDRCPGGAVRSTNHTGPEGILHQERRPRLEAVRVEAAMLREHLGEGPAQHICGQGCSANDRKSRQPSCRRRGVLSCAMNPDVNKLNAASEVLLAWLGQLRLGAPMHCGPLALVPVYRGEQIDPVAYRTLPDALGSGAATISEHTSATVPSLRLVNHGQLPILLLDGEEVAGGLQNRVVNTTLLIASTCVFDLPVSCIEHGRWHAVRKDFEAGEAVHPTLRRQKAEQVTAGFAAASAPLADQSAVWAEVAERQRRTGTRSATSALRDAFVMRQRDLAIVERELRFPTDHPTGVVALVAGRAMCADLFDRSDTLRQYWSRLIRSYALEAIGEATEEPRLDSARRLLSRPNGAACRPFHSPGLGADVRIMGNGVVGSCLVYADRVLHAALFRGRSPGASTRMRSPGERRRSRLQ